MNDIQLDYFLAVATNHSFTKTSEELFVSQPAISRQIAALEKELGVKLFTRNNKKTELSEAGKLYYDLFKNYKADFIKTKHEADAIELKKDRIINIGFLEGWDLSGILPHILGNFNKIYPEYKLFINCCGIKELSTLILTGGLDLAVLNNYAVDDIPEIETEKLCEIEKNIIYSKNNSKYNTKQNLNPEDFKDDIFLAPYGIVENIVSKAVSGYLKEYGFMPKLQYVPNFESMISCVRNCMGVAITDEWVWALVSDDLGVLEIDARDSIVLAMMKSNNDVVARNLAEIVKEAVTSIKHN